MKESCQFLQPDLLTKGFRCAAGVNFASVGANRERCSFCPVGQFDEWLSCPDLEVYTFLEGGAGASPIVKVRALCRAEAPASGRLCASCLEGVEKVSPIRDVLPAA